MFRFNIQPGVRNVAGSVQTSEMAFPAGMAAVVRDALQAIGIDAETEATKAEVIFDADAASRLGIDAIQFARHIGEVYAYHRYADAGALRRLAAEAEKRPEASIGPAWPDESANERQEATA